MVCNLLKVFGAGKSRLKETIRFPTRKIELERLEDRLVPSTHFGVIGDYGQAGPAEQNVANLVASWNPDFVVTVGDNNYPNGDASTIDANIGQYYHSYIYPYVGSYGAGASTNLFWPCLGNHDYSSTAGFTPYLNYFTLPNNGRYYDFTQGPVEFFAIDANSQEPDGNTSTSTQAQWLQTQLAASTATWKLVYFHQPPYSSTSAQSPWMQWPFQTWGATAVLTGHAHVYERLVENNNFPYFVDGLGGAGIGSFGTPISGSELRYSGDNGAMLVDASDTQITFKFINRSGQLIDNYTLYSNPTAYLPAAPTSLTGTLLSASQINLAWTDNSSNETGFKIERSTDGTTYTQIATVGANVTTYSDAGLTPNTQYYYRVRATDMSGDSAYSNVVTLFTGVPAAPSNLTVTVASRTQINLAWTDNSSNETGFKIERSTDGTNFTQIATVGTGTTNYNNQGLTGGTTYYYRVRATNVLGDSTYSNVASTTTSQPAAPRNLTATAVSASQINLAWTDNSNNETGFKIQRSPNGATWIQIATVGVDVTSYSDTGLAASTTYYYRVKAYNGAGGSDFSNVASATTTSGGSGTPSLQSAIGPLAQAGDVAGVGNDINRTGFTFESSTDDRADLARMVGSGAWEETTNGCGGWPRSWAPSVGHRRTSFSSLPTSPESALGLVADAQDQGFVDYWVLPLPRASEEGEGKVN